MYVNLIFCAIIASVLVAPGTSKDTADGGIVSGRVKTTDGSHCTWFEVKSGPKESSLGMACVCRNAAGKKQGYNCQYVGELEECPEYRTDSSRFFSELIAQLSGGYLQLAVSICSHDQVDCT